MSDDTPQDFDVDGFDADNIDEAGGWTCPECDWSGEKAPIDWRRLAIECPECGTVLNDSVGRYLEENEHVDWKRGGGV